MTKSCALFLMLFLQACALFKNTKKESQSESSTVEKEVAASSTLLLDSSVVEKLEWKNEETEAANQHIVIWPRGKFSFSPGRGFEGEADRIAIQGERWRKTASELEALSQTQLALVRHEKLLEKARLEERKKQQLKTSKPPWSVYLVMVLALLLGLLAWLLKYKRVY